MKIEINDTYYVDFAGDSYNPFKKALTPRKDKKTGKIATHIHCGKYFMSLEHALKWVVIDSLNSEYESVKLEDYIKIYTSKTDELTEACKGLK